MIWDDYYLAHGRDPQPSPFARAVEPRFPRRARVIDLGCGDGHDARFFADHGHLVTAVDRSAVAVALIDDPRIDAFTADAAGLPTYPTGFDVAYLRWLLHAVPVQEQRAVLGWCARNANVVYIEARSVHGEHPIDHFRRPIDAVDLSVDLRHAGYDVIAMEEGYGFSRRGEDDPLLLRVAASLSSRTAGVVIPTDQRKGRRR